MWGALFWLLLAKPIELEVKKLLPKRHEHHQKDFVHSNDACQRLFFEDIDVQGVIRLV